MTTIMNGNLAFPKKYVVAALALLMLCVLSRTIAIICRMVFAPARVVSVSTGVHAAVPKIAIVAKKVPVVTNPEEIKGWTLNSNSRPYQVLMSGQVLCGDQPCPAQLQITLSSARHPNMHKTAQTNSDGSYEIAFAFSELPHEQVDWKIVATNDSIGSTETHGRQILTDDSTLDVSDTLQLHS